MNSSSYRTFGGGDAGGGGGGAHQEDAKIQVPDIIDLLPTWSE